VSFSQDNTDILLNETEYLISQQKFNDANDLLNSVLEIQKTNSKAFYLRSIVSLEIGNIKGAISDLDFAIKYDKNNDFYFSERAEIFLTEKKYNKAFEDFNQAYLLNSNELKYLLKKSISEYFLNKSSEALTNIQKYLETNSTNDEAYYYCALIYSENNELSKSLEFVNKSLEKNKSKAEYFLLRANNYTKLEQFELADNDYGMALDLNPKLAEAYFNRGNLRFKTGDKSGACFDWNKALELKYRKADDKLRENCW
jgi:tetratricopeptide (TPR) repeat protein